MKRFAALALVVLATTAVLAQSERRSPVFYIAGYITNPGSYNLRPGLTVDQAIQLAGGITDHGSESGIEIRRAPKEGTSNPVRIKASLDDKVQADDEIYVPKR